MLLHLCVWVGVGVLLYGVLLYAMISQITVMQNNLFLCSCCTTKPTSMQLMNMEIHHCTMPASGAIPKLLK